VVGAFLPVVVAVKVTLSHAGDIDKNVNDPLVVARPLTSVALTVKVAVPADPPRVPEINPDEDKDNPVGKLPEARV
jgi:hypothetical protein